jgi:hypothetical protein
MLPDEGFRQGAALLDISNIFILSSFYPIVKHQANILIEKDSPGFILLF